MCLVAIITSIRWDFFSNSAKLTEKRGAAIYTHPSVTGFRQRSPLVDRAAVRFNINTVANQQHFILKLKLNRFETASNASAAQNTDRLAAAKSDPRQGSQHKRMPPERISASAKADPTASRDGDFHRQLPWRCFASILSG